MRQVIVQALKVFREFPELSEIEIFERLIEAGIENRIAARLVELLPLAYYRTIIVPAGTKVSDSYARMDEAGIIGSEYPLASIPLWNEIVTYADEEIRNGLSEADLFAVAWRSSERAVVEQLLKADSNYNAIGLVSPIFGWPVNGPIMADTIDDRLGSEAPHNIGQGSLKHDTSPKKSTAFQTLTWILKIGMIVFVMSGLIHLFSLTTQSYSNTKLGDMLFNLSFGVLYFVCERLLSKERLVSMYVFVFTIIFSIAYSYFMGRGFNYLSLIGGGYVLSQFLAVKKNDEIS